MNDPHPDNLTFEQSLAELERLVRALEDGQIGLEESLTCYEKGVGLLKKCYGQLAVAEQRILVLTGTDGDGKPMTALFDHVATVETDSKAKRKKSP